MDKPENIFTQLEVRRLVNVFKETLANNGVVDGQMNRKIFRQFLHERLGVRWKIFEIEKSGVIMNYTTLIAFVPLIIPLEKVRNILFSEVFMADRMFDYFNHDGKDDITKTEWISGLQIIMKGTEEQQAEFCFQVTKNNFTKLHSEMLKGLNDKLLVNN